MGKEFNLHCIGLAWTPILSLMEECASFSAGRGYKKAGMLATPVTIGQMRGEGAEAVILGCTDIQHYLFQKDTAMPLIDTFSVLKASSLRLLGTKPSAKNHTVKGGSETTENQEK